MDTRVAAYAVVVDDGGILLAHWNESGRSGWSLPGGGIDPGEDPCDAVVREVREETGLDVVVEELLGIDSHIIGVENRIELATVAQHAIRVVYRARVVGGDLSDEIDGSTDLAAWVPLAEVRRLDRVELVDTGMTMAGVGPGAASAFAGSPGGAALAGPPGASALAGPGGAALGGPGGAALAGPDGDPRVASDGSPVLAPGDVSLIAAERALQGALRTGDVELLDTMLHPDAHYVSPEGVITDRADDLEAHRSGTLRLSSVRERSLGATTVGAVGVTTAVLDLGGVDHGYAFETTLAYTRTWLHEDGAWRVLAAHASVVHPG